jgi:hypothetical protein
MSYLAEPVLLDVWIIKADVETDYESCFFLGFFIPSISKIFVLDFDEAGLTDSVGSFEIDFLCPLSRLKL